MPGGDKNNGDKNDDVDKNGGVGDKNAAGIMS